MVVLRLDAVRSPVRLALADAWVDHRARPADSFGRPDIAVVDIDQGPAGKVAIHDHFEDIVVQIGTRKVPVIVVGFVEEIQAIETLDPTHLDLDVQVLRVVVHAVTLLRCP